MKQPCLTDYSLLNCCFATVLDLLDKRKVVADLVELGLLTNLGGLSVLYYS